MYPSRLRFEGHGEAPNRPTAAPSWSSVDCFTAVAWPGNKGIQGIQGIQGCKGYRGYKDTRDTRDTGDTRIHCDARDTRDIRIHRDARDARDTRIQGIQGGKDELKQRGPKDSDTRI